MALDAYFRSRLSRFHIFEVVEKFLVFLLLLSKHQDDIKK